MSNTQNSSFSLLNQKEIDSLIGFLSEQKNSLDSDVLSQKSIDKLIKVTVTGLSRMYLIHLHMLTTLYLQLLVSERMFHSYANLSFLSMKLQITSSSRLTTLLRIRSLS